MLEYNAISDSLSGIAEGRYFEPYAVPPAVLQRAIRKIQSERMDLRGDDDLVHSLADIVELPLQLVKHPIGKALGLKEIYVIPLPLACAYSQRLSQREIIVIGSGFIDLLEAAAFSAQIIGRLPAEAESIYPLPELAILSLSDIFANFLTALIASFYRSGEALPNIIGLLSKSEIEAARLSFSGAVMFTLLHELGHLELGHIGGETTRIAAMKSAVEEDLSIHQKQELEADAYAISALSAEYQEFGHFWMKSAADFLVRLNILTGLNSESHPLAINRVYHLNETQTSTSNYHDANKTRSVYERHALKFIESKNDPTSSENHWLSLDRHTILTVLSRVSGPLLDLGLDINPLFEQDGTTWIENLKFYGKPGGPGNG